jgi:1-acyl-sn-glycerol-3-phosphate acyltransferase
VPILRSLLFSLAFYGGSVFHVTGALLMIALAPARLPILVRRWSSFHRACVTRILRIDVVETGRRPAGQALYAVKHESFFEAIDLPNLFDHPVVFAKQELFAVPGWGRAAAAYGVVPVARQEGARALRTMIRDAQRMAGMGRPLIIFPEGTRIPHGARAPLQSGFAMLYKVLGLPVIPVAVNSGPVYGGFRKRRGTIQIRFGEPIGPGLSRAELETRVLEAINALNPPEQPLDADAPPSIGFADRQAAEKRAPYDDAKGRDA